jgi:dihydrofolate reductase
MNPISSVFIATSLDGYIARKGGELDWLDAANKAVPEGEDCGYHAFFDSVVMLVMGRKTFENVLSFIQQWPYSKPVTVLSRNKLIIPDELITTVSHSSESPKDLCQRLSRKGVKRLYIDGGVTIQRFLAEDLINDLTITVIPIILGSGIPLFGATGDDINLRHLATKNYDFGFVQLTYEVVKKGAKQSE